MKKIAIMSLILSSVALSAMKDGVYSAESKEESRGWKSKVELTVKDGKITVANLEDFNAEGAKKSLDAAYNTRWKERSKINFAEAVPMLTADLLKKQDISKIDNVAGATALSETFKKLSAAALKNAETGNTTTAIVE